MVNDTGLVVGIEHIKQLCDIGINNINKHHSDLLRDKKIIIVNGDGRLGCEKYAPYKAIHVGTAIPHIPKELINQLDYNGRMFIPVGERNKTQWICLIDKILMEIFRKLKLCLFVMVLKLLLRYNYKIIGKNNCF